MVSKRGRGGSEKGKETVTKAQGTDARPRLKRSTPARLGDAIKVSARDGQSYTDILKEMKAKVDPQKAGI